MPGNLSGRAKSGVASIKAGGAPADSARVPVGGEREAPAPGAGGAKHVQIAMSPYFGQQPDFSPLVAARPADTALDLVSVADLLRNGFVYAPHSIFENVKLATHGFDPSQDMCSDPTYRFMFRDSEKSQEHDDADHDWVGTYHRLLCEAMADACSDMRSPWLLQSGGKDSTPLAIAASEVRPDTRCITYLGGSEENEVASATYVAHKLGLHHETLVCDPERAYDRYLALVGRMPLLTADFALLSYVDLATHIAALGGDGLIDGMGADAYFGWLANPEQRMLYLLARGMRLPPFATELPLIGRSFKLCYLLSTLQMQPEERVFPGSRFTDAEVDEMFGRPISKQSRNRLSTFRDELARAKASSIDEWQAIASSIAGQTGAFAKGMYTANALGLRAAYPFCHGPLREWVYRKVPLEQLADPVTRANKVLVRRHIATRFEDLPYVSRKGSFRFDLCGLARLRFEQVHKFGLQARHVLPGAVTWLERNRGRLDNKYYASKFYLLAVVLPWIVKQGDHGRAGPQAGAVPERRVQITMSPYYGAPDLSTLAGKRTKDARIDSVSVADLLRNGFVYPPHSIYEDVKLATYGFDPAADMYGTPEFRFAFRDSGKRHRHDAGGEGLVKTYHRLLCQALSTTCEGMAEPWLLQSGGKDSTSLAIAAAEARPDITCITYLGGREENEIASAQLIATQLGLKHEVLVCDTARAYDRYLQMIDRMPLLTADFALLSYVDLASTIAASGGDGVIDGLGSDIYLGAPASRQHRLLLWLARNMRLPRFIANAPFIQRSFRLAFGLATLQMDPVERLFPGSRFTNAEADELFGRDIAQLSRARLAPFRTELESASSLDELRAMTVAIAESASALAKGVYTTSALGLRGGYPYCDRGLREWIYRQVPTDQHIDPATKANKALVRRHIATRFGELPYVAAKGSFRFDLRRLPQQKFEQVHAFAEQVRDLLPGARAWLERNRDQFDNKYQASKFYLLAVVLPWVAHHQQYLGRRSTDD